MTREAAPARRGAGGITARQVSLLAAVGFAIAAPAVQALGHIGLSPADFARAGDETLRAAGYAFSVWGVIYAGLVAFAVYQALPRQRVDPLLKAIAGPALVAILGTGLWIWASAFDLRWGSVGIITVSAAYLTLGLLRAARRIGTPTPPHRVLVWWPLSVLAGWLALASAINILTVLTAGGLIRGHEPAAAISGLVAVFLVAMLVLRTPRMATFGLPVAWGLTAVWIAEYDAKSGAAALAIGEAIMVASYAVWQSRPFPRWRRRPQPGRREAVLRRRS